MSYQPKEALPLPDPVPVLTMRDVIRADDEGIPPADAGGERKFLAGVLLDRSFVEMVLMDFDEARLAVQEVNRQKFDMTAVNAGETEPDPDFGGVRLADPRYWNENQDNGHRTVMLTHPIRDDDGTEHTSVTLRRYKLGDEPPMNLTPTRRSIKIVSNLTGLPLKTVSQMYIGDFSACTLAVADFLGVT